MRLGKASFCVVSAILLSALPSLAHSATPIVKQKYTTIVVFGDSLSDTGNDTELTLLTYGVPVPSPVADYTYGSFTDGPDTTPAAQNYFGVWVQQLAAMLPGQPSVVASLDGGTNYAYGLATAGPGTSVFTLGSTGLSVNVDNVGKQITDYLATNPTINDQTLFIVWGGAINVLDATRPLDVVAGAVEDAVDVQRLIAAGATQILVPNLPALGDTPDLDGLPATAKEANQATNVFNQTLSAGLDALKFVYGKQAHIYRLDVHALFQHVVASPASFDLVNVTSEAQGAAVNPDTYLFWDYLHPTTRGHNVLALRALKVIDPAACKVRVQLGEQPCETASGAPAP